MPFVSFVVAPSPPTRGGRAMRGTAQGEHKESGLLKHRKSLPAAPKPVWVAVLLAPALLAGCNETTDLGTWNPFAPSKKLSAPAGSISIYELATRLTLMVKSATATSATLVKPGNQVTIYADPGGQVYVNGRVVVQGGIVAVGSVLHVPGETPIKIQQALREYRRRPPKRRARPRKPGPVKIAGRIVIDPGHGGRDPGAIAAMGVQEKAVVLDVAQQVAERLRAAGATVTLTRSTDTSVELEERAAIANRLGASLFVSIHADSAPRRSAEGFGTYVARSASAQSSRVAAAIEGSLSGAGVPRHGTFRRDFRVLVLTRCPAVLVELGFLSNPTEAARLATWAYRRRLAEAVAEGICTFVTAK